MMIVKPKHGMITFMLAACLLAAGMNVQADSRIQRIIYDDTRVFEVRGAQGIATQIVFADGEEITSVASGFTDGWQFVPKGNSLHLKPRSLEQEAGIIAPVPGKWNTNLNVSTNRRNYSFSLRLADNAASAQVAYRVVFEYPQDAALAAAMAAEAQRKEAVLNAPPAMPTPRNTAYTISARRKSLDIAPTVVFDDGRFTYFKFPVNREIPAIFIVSASGEESIVNHHMEHDFVIVQRVARQFVIRLGNQRVTIRNTDFQLEGIPTDGQTTIEGVERTIKENASE